MRTPEPSDSKFKVQWFNGLMVNSSEFNGSMVQSKNCCIRAPYALGIGAASFFREGGDEAEKDRAESPTAEPERPKKDNCQQTTDNSLCKPFKINNI